MSKLTRNLAQAVKKLAHRTSVDELKERGLKQVNVIGVDRIVALIEEAVSRSLHSKLAGLDRAEVATEAGEEFRRLLQSNEDLQRKRGELDELRRKAELEVERLRSELGKQREQLDQRLGLDEISSRTKARELASFGADSVLHEQLDEHFESLSKGESDLRGLRAAVHELVRERIGAERARAEAAEARADAGEIEKLQRRVAKLSKTLSETEQQLQRAASAPVEDDGVASVYKEVQGLQTGSAHYEKKKELMSVIFKANLALQKGPQAPEETGGGR